MPAASCGLTTRSSTILLQIARMLSRLNGKCGPQCEECAYTNRNMYQAINVSTNAAETAHTHTRVVQTSFTKKKNEKFD